MNVFVISGRLAQTPELQTGKSGMPYIRFGVAVKKAFQGRKKVEGKGAKPDFLNLMAFGTNAKYLAMYGKRGDRVDVVGHIASDNKKGEDGKTWRNVNLMVDSIEIIFNNKEKESTGEKTTLADVMGASYQKGDYARQYDEMFGEYEEGEDAADEEEIDTDDVPF